MTELDRYEPVGEPIHPYDVYDLIVAHGLAKELGKEPECEDEFDYMRNLYKLGEIIEINGVVYRQTPRVPYKSTSFGEKP